MKIRANILVIPRITLDTGRTYDRIERGRHCLTCASNNSGPAPYTGDCGRAGHAIRRRSDVTVTERAPGEAKTARALYGHAHRELGRLGHHAGGSVYLVPRERRMELDAWIGEVRDRCAEFSERSVVCRVSFFCDVAEIDPATSHVETLRSIQDRIERSVQAILEALEAGDAGAIRKVARETRNLSSLVEGEASQQIGKLAVFSERLARTLRDAAQAGEAAAERAAEEAKLGAARFGAIFDDLFSPPAPAREADTPEEATL